MLKRTADSKTRASGVEKRRRLESDTNQLLSTGITKSKLTNEDYTVGWICAISTEYVAAQAFLDKLHERPEYQSPNDNNDYTLGEIGNHNVVIAVLPGGEYGIASAAHVATSMLHSFPNIRIGLMVGIGGGAPNKDYDIRLGDIVVSTPYNKKGGVFQYDFGKTIQEQKFQYTGFLDQPPTVLRTAVNGLQAQYELNGHELEEAIKAAIEKKSRLRKRYSRPDANTDRLYQTSVIHDEKCCNNAIDHDTSKLVSRLARTEDEDNPAVHYGLIASANQLMKNAEDRDRLSQDEGVICFEMEAAGLMNHFPCLVIRGICDYSDTHKNMEWQGYASMAAAAYAKDLLSRIPRNKVEAERKIIELIEDHLNKTHKKLDDISQKMAFGKLPTVPEAAFDSGAEEHKSTCLEETRVEILDQISKWAGNPQAETIFWLSGMAGTGKSTIARTVAHSFSKTGQLGASFFFKRGEGDRGTASKFFPTIADHLVQRTPALAIHVKNAIEGDPSIFGKGLREQFETLIRVPMSKVPKDDGKVDSIVIVVDALDECDEDEDAKLIIGLFSCVNRSRMNGSQPLRLQIFITSRPEHRIRLGFSEIDKGTHQDILLHEVAEQTIEHDLYIYFEHELRKIKRKHDSRGVFLDSLPPIWPKQSDIESLVERAMPLFIYAATICRFLDDDRTGDPETKLQKVLQYEAKSLESKLDITYMPVLDQLVSNLRSQDREDVLRLFKRLVGSIIILGTPLSASTLADFLGIQLKEINSHLNYLHSVLSIPSSATSPVQLLHLSFRDFLLDPSQKTLFHINGKEAHKTSVDRCLRAMDGALQTDICKVEWPGTPSSSIDTQKLDDNIPPKVQYACRYWVYHVEQAGCSLYDDDEVYHFLKKHFLHWLEVLSLLGRVQESIQNIQTLQSLLQPQNSTKLLAFFEDARRFVLANMSIIQEAPLQIYCSALPFAPEESIIRRWFQGDIPDWISLSSGIDTHWDNCLQVLDGHTSMVLSVAFSPDSTRIVSGSTDATVRLWWVDTGTLQWTLRGHRGSVRSVTFSPNSKLIASASDDGTVRLWSADTGLSEYDYTHHNAAVKSVAFSPDSALIAYVADDGTLTIHSVKGEIQKLLRSPSDLNESVVFSPNSELIATSTGDKGKVAIWSIRGELLNTFEGNSVAFLHDSNTIVSGSDNGAIRFWSADTGTLQRTMKGPDMVMSLAISPDSKLIAAGDFFGNLWLQQSDAGGSYSFRGHTNAINSVAFSPDSRGLLASGAHDNTIRLWSIDTKALASMDSQGSLPDTIRFFKLSPDGKLIASNTNNNYHLIQLWSTDTGLLLRTLEGYVGVITQAEFSPDSKLIAATSWGKKIWLWSTDGGSPKSIPEAYDDINHIMYDGILAISPDSNIIAWTSDKDTLRLWSINTGAQRILQNHGGPITSVRFSPDSRRIISISSGYILRLWAADSGLLLHTLEGRRCKGTSATFSHDSKFIASLSEHHRTIRIWSVGTGKLQQVLGDEDDSEQPEWYGGLYSSVAFSPDSKLVVSCHHEMQIWSLDTGDCLRVIDLGLWSRNLYFNESGRILVTDAGAFSCEYLPQSADTANNVADEASAPTPTQALSNQIQVRRIGYGISPDRSWITVHGKDLLRIPGKYRPVQLGVSGSTVVIQTRLGKLLILRFSYEDNPSSLGHPSGQVHA